MSTDLSAEFARLWVERWDRQQERYVADREERFAVICDVVGHALAGKPGTVLDLGCGPGSLSVRTLRRLPQARVIGIDGDPLLLGLGRAYCGDRIEFLEADLRRPEWTDGLPERVDAVVSTTALHWLDADQLPSVYSALARLVRPGGVFVNGDNLPPVDAAIRELTDVVRDRHADRTGVSRRERWDDWWEAVHSDPSLTDLAKARAERGVFHQHGNKMSADGHAELLRQSGFSAAGPVWQTGDDHVLVAVR